MLFTSLLRVCSLVIEDFLVLRRQCKKYAFAPVTENCKRKQFPRLTLSHILLLVFVDSETLRKWKEKCLGHFLPIFSTSDTLNVIRHASGIFHLLNQKQMEGKGFKG
jgi:hypothetical protein